MNIGFIVMVLTLLALWVALGVAVYDSRKKWPDKSAWTRFSYIITFKR